MITILKNNFFFLEISNLEIFPTYITNTSQLYWTKHDGKIRPSDERRRAHKRVKSDGGE